MQIEKSDHMKKTLVIAATAIAAFSCGQSGGNDITMKNLSGKWIEIMPVNKDIVQGMTLYEDGKAESVGMATLQYKSWEITPEKKIILNGLSIGNHQTIEFSDTLDIISVSGDTLTLDKFGKYRIQYTREDENGASGNRPEKIGGTPASAGYTHSKLKNSDIRVFEEGTKVMYATGEEHTSAAFIVFNGDSSKLEIFLPDAESAVLERRTRPDGSHVWNVEDDDTYNVEECSGGWIVSRRGRIIFASSGTENTVKCTFTEKDKDGKTYNAVFFNNHELVQLESDGMYYILKQYRTASGFGYKSPAYDLRGKGREAVLTSLYDNTKTELVEKQ